MKRAWTNQKKVLLAHGLKSLFAGRSGFVDRTDIMLFFARTNEELLRIHSWERANLIVSALDLPGMKSEELFGTIRNSGELRQVSTIILCKDTLDQRERSRQCGANAVFTVPVDTALLEIKMHQFLNVAPRKAYRAMLAVAIQGKFRNRPLPFRTENISASGMLISSSEPLRKGEAVFFSFFLPNGAHASGYGEIVRAARRKSGQDGFLYGIRFTNVDQPVRAAIEAMIDKQPFP